MAEGGEHAVARARSIEPHGMGDGRRRLLKEGGPPNRYLGRQLRAFTRERASDGRGRFMLSVSTWMCSLAGPTSFFVCPWGRIVAPNPPRPFRVSGGEHERRLVQRAVDQSLPTPHLDAHHRSHLLQVPPPHALERQRELPTLPAGGGNSGAYPQLSASVK